MKNDNELISTLWNVITSFQAVISVQKHSWDSLQAVAFYVVAKSGKMAGKVFME